VEPRLDGWRYPQVSARRRLISPPLTYHPDDESPTIDRVDARSHNPPLMSLLVPARLIHVADWRSSQLRRFPASLITCAEGGAGKNLRTKASTVISKVPRVAS